MNYNVCIDKSLNIRGVGRSTHDSKLLINKQSDFKTSYSDSIVQCSQIVVPNTLVICENLLEMHILGLYSRRTRQNSGKELSNLFLVL